MAKRLSPISPGEILLEEFLRPLGVSQNELARAIGVPPGRINDIIHARRSITRDTAARFALFFRTSPDVWLTLQARYDAKLAERELMPTMSRTIRPVRPSAA
jgi:addiction module HigA family antidote